ncbi:MAG: DUF3857 domain-containing protein [Cytophagaceae bacterium]
MMIRLNCQSRVWALFCLALVFSLPGAYSQENIFGGLDPDFDLKDVPDKWKNESAVILCQKTTCLFDKSYAPGYGNSITQKEVTRKRIKLLDRAAVEEYSEFYFVATKDLGVRIIKPDGSIEVIDLKDAVPVARNVSIPGVYKSASGWEKEYKKLAIAGLEPNDIIDYFNIIKHTYYMTTGEYVFPEVILSLENSFPAVKQKYEFNVDQELYFNFRSLNGAPEMEGGLAAEEGLKFYSFTDTSREKLKDERWSYIYRSTPTIKFQVVYRADPRVPTEYLLGKAGELKTSVSKEEIALKANELIFAKNKSIDKLSKMILKYLSSHKELASGSDIAKASYYLYRNVKFTNGVNNFGNDDRLFVACLARVFDKKKIAYQVMSAVPRQIGTLESLVLKDELIWFLKLSESGTFLCAPSINANFGDVFSGIEGAEAYQVGVSKSKELLSADKILIPVSTMEQNGESDKIEVGLNPEMDYITVSHVKTVRGHSRESFESAIIYGDSRSAPERYNFQVSPDMSGMYEQKRKRMERFKSYVAEDFDLLKYEDFTLLKSGRYEDEPNIEYSEKYKIKGLLKKAGSNYIFHAGRLIGTQVEIGEGEMKRSYEVYSDCPRSFYNEVSVIIPDGYIVKGIEKLTMKVSTEAGSFSSEAWMDGKILKFRTSKIYFHNFERNKDWGKMVQFLDAAYDFTEARILLKRTE